MSGRLQTFSSCHASLGCESGSGLCVGRGSHPVFIKDSPDVSVHWTLHFMSCCLSPSQILHLYIYIPWCFIHSKGATKTPVWERDSTAFESTQGNIERTELSQFEVRTKRCMLGMARCKKKRRKKEAVTNRERAGEWANPPKHPYIAPYLSPTACKRPGM